jgi:hypothetical protein
MKQKITNPPDLEIEDSFIFSNNRKPTETGSHIPMTKGNSMLKMRARERNDYALPITSPESNGKYKRSVLSPAMQFGSNAHVSHVLSSVQSQKSLIRSSHPSMT